MESDMKIIMMTVGVIVSFGSIGCAVNADSTGDLLDEAEQEIFQAGCATLPADVIINALTNPLWSHNGPSMPRSGCIGSHIVDVNNYQEGTDVRVSGAQVGWGDVELTTKVECERAWVGTSVYLKTGSTYTHVKSTSHHGVWVDLPPSCSGTLCLELDHCDAPITVYVSSVADGESYRFVGSARRLAIPNGDPSGDYLLRNMGFEAREIPRPPR
jgi:hypothetical protein